MILRYWIIGEGDTWHIRGFAEHLDRNSVVKRVNGVRRFYPAAIVGPYVTREDAVQSAQRLWKGE